LALIIIGEFNDHFKSGLGFKIRLPMYFDEVFSESDAETLTVVNKKNSLLSILLHTQSFSRIDRVANMCTVQKLR
jgi:hypothetical protein